jgi:hypothetical protein
VVESTPRPALVIAEADLALTVLVTESFDQWAAVG